jgi:hypothetical protein
MPDGSLAGMFLAQLTPAAAAAASVIITLLTAVFIFTRRRPIAFALGPTLCVLLNPLFLFGLRRSDHYALFAGASILTFAGLLALAEEGDDKGTVALATGAASGVALIGFVPFLHAPLALFSLLLSPWKSSIRHLSGFFATAFAPSLMVIAAAAYLVWLYPAAAHAKPAAAAAPGSVSNFLALLAAPSIFLGLATRFAAVMSMSILASACYLAPPHALPLLGLVAFGAETAWCARLRRGATASLMIAGALSAALLWSHLGEPGSLSELKMAIMQFG